MEDELVSYVRVELLCRYLNYYSTVYYTIIDEAIEKTIEDLELHSKKDCDVDQIHKHIVENYI